MQILEQTASKIVLRDTRGWNRLAVGTGVAVIAAVAFVFFSSVSYSVSSCSSSKVGGCYNGHPATFLDRLPFMSVSVIIGVFTALWVLTNLFTAYSEYAFEKSDMVLTVHVNRIVPLFDDRKILKFDHIQLSASSASVLAVYIIAAGEVVCWFQVRDDNDNAAKDTVRKFFGSDLASNGLPPMGKIMSYSRRYYFPYLK